MPKNLFSGKMLFSLFFLTILLAVVFVQETVSKHNLRITNGQEATRGDIPYFAQIVHAETKTICGGALISKQHVLTIKDCLSGHFSNYYIRLGSNIADDGEKINIDASSQIDNEDEILIVTMRLTVDYDHYKAPVALPLFKQLFAVNTHAVISGFGALRKGAKTEKRLHHENTLVIPTQVCNSKLGKTLSNNYICAGYESGYIDVCDGDIGTPLVGTDQVLIGIATRQYSCGEPNKPSVYVLVSMFTDKISDYTDTIDSNRLTNTIDNCSNRTFKWKDVTKSYNMSIFFEYTERRLRFMSESEDHCILNPISFSTLVISNKCLPKYELNTPEFTLKKNLRFKLNDKVYKVNKLVTGAEILPFFGHKNVDIIVIELSEPMDFLQNTMIFQLMPALQKLTSIPGVLIKSIINPVNRSELFASTPVEIIEPIECRRKYQDELSFMITDEMFCITHTCWGSVNNLCSKKEGSPVFDTLGNFLGIVIYQENCYLHKPLVALRLATFIQIFKEFKMN